MKIPYYLLLPFLFIPITHADHAADMQRSMELFTSTIRPFFVDQCLECHGGKKVKSAFNLNTREGLIAGGDQGVVVVPGKPDESPLLAYVSHREEPHMPPKKPAVTGELYQALENWVQLGAAYDQPLGGEVEIDGPMVVTEEDKEFWSFAPLAAAKPPQVRNAAWVKNPIDQFIAAAHEKRGLKPAAALDRRSLIRRAYFDLIGLPPTPSEVQAFVDDPRADALSDVVAGLLARPEHGERWARHWLDVARFAESHGFEHDYDRKNAYHYRDFVIQALNQDMPWTQMVKWQLAGDEFAPDEPLAMMATGFLGAGVYPTQITVAEAERIRYDAIDDMLATTTTAMLGLSVGCARCHDHKFDPIPALDYYRMASAFTTTVRSDVDVAKPISAKTLAAFEDKLHALEAARTEFEQAKLPARMQAWLAEQSKSDAPLVRWHLMHLEGLTSAGGATMTPQPDRSILVTGKNTRDDVYTLTGKTGLNSLRAFRIEPLAHKSMKRNGPGRAGNGNFGLSHVAVSWRAVGSTGAYQPLTLANPRVTFEQNKSNLSIAGTIDSNDLTGWAVDPQFGKNHAAVYEVVNPPQGDQEVELKVVLTFKLNTQHNFGLFRLSVSEEAAAELPLQESVDTLQASIAEIRKQMDAGKLAEAVALYKVHDPVWSKLNSAVAQHQKADPRKANKMKVMVCAEGYKPMRHHVADGSIKDFYPETFVLHRGDVNQKLEVADLGYLQVLSRHPKPEHNWRIPQREGAKGSFRRASLASWMCDVDHGAGHLMARVIVNRLWQHHFGEGLVATPNNFGFSGAPASHPELLDWLAGELIRQQWKLKPIHTLIMESATYQMGAAVDTANAQVDVENTLLWKRAPRRLEAEAIRDAMLAVSGTLDPTMYGPGTLSESHKRRSIYFMVKRSKLVPFLQVFDFPDTLNSLGKRSVTTTSLQALVFMNHPEVRKMAEAFAKRVAALEGDPVTQAYEIAFARPPTEREQKLGQAYIAQQSLADFCQALFSMNEFVFIP